MASSIVGEGGGRDADALCSGSAPRQATTTGRTTTNRRIIAGAYVTRELRSLLQFGGLRLALLVSAASRSIAL
jgi:hypothetical protein